MKSFIWRADQLLFGGRLQDTLKARKAEASLRKLMSQASHRQLVAFEPIFGSLHQLCDTWGSDKGSTPGFTDRPYLWPPHTYAALYQTLFEHCREHVKLVFECGLGTSDASIPNNMGARGRAGASLRVWRDYFPNALVFGADIDRKSLFQEPRIETHWVDQTCPKAIARLWSDIGRTGFDLIIDDGLHTFGAGKIFFEGSWDRLRPGGVFVIEDVSMPNLLKYQDYFKQIGVSAELHVLQRQSMQPFDNNLVLVRRMTGVR